MLKLQERIVFKKYVYFSHRKKSLIQVSIWFLIAPLNSVSIYRNFVHNILQAFDNIMSSFIVFCDVSKAVDRVWHTGLMYYPFMPNGISHRYRLDESISV